MSWCSVSIEDMAYGDAYAEVDRHLCPDVNTAALQAVMSTYKWFQQCAQTNKPGNPYEPVLKHFEDNKFFGHLLKQVCKN